MKCNTCNKKLSGRQRKYCSIKCKRTFISTKHNNYRCQQNRAIRRKQELVKMLGGECCKCGYKKNTAALEFHHIDPTTKKMKLDARILSNSKWINCLNESKKCILLCSNCHAEHHHPQCNVNQDVEISLNN
jgi:hypothetical protein